MRNATRRVAHSNRNSQSHINEGAPFFRVLCGRVGGENIRSELSISVPDRRLHWRAANHANRQFRGPLFIIDHKLQTR
jgi:hypothetical protein